MLSQNHDKPVISSVGDALELQKLVLAAKQGDERAFEVLYTKLLTPLYRYVISRCHNKELAEDICQQTFLKFYQALSNYEPDKTPLAYLFTIAKRLLINNGEKKTNLPVDETFFETIEDESADILDDAHIKMLAESINEYLPLLSGDEQDVIRLYFYGEFSHKEIAEIIEREEVYVRKIKERALKKLRALTQHIHEGH